MGWISRRSDPWDRGKLFIRYVLRNIPTLEIHYPESQIRVNIKLTWFNEKNRLRTTLIYTAILVVTLLAMPAFQNDMLRLKSWVIILLADFALGAVLLYVPGVWSYEIIIMYILCGRAVLVRSGSPVSDLLWLTIVWALIQPWYYFIARRTIRRCNSKLGRQCWKSKNISVWEIQKFFIPSYVCILVVIAIFGIAFPMFVGVSRHEIIRDLWIGLPCGFILGLLRYHEFPLILVLIFGPLILLPFTGNSYSQNSLTTMMIACGSFITACLRGYATAFPSFYESRMINNRLFRRRV